MKLFYSGADTLVELLTGASAPGLPQPNPNLSLGGNVSGTPDSGLGMFWQSYIDNVRVLYASYANPLGLGNLSVVDSNSLAWASFGGSLGPAVDFSLRQTQLMEADSHPEQYLRVYATPPFDRHEHGELILSYPRTNVFGFRDTIVSGAISQYRATALKPSSDVTRLRRWISPLSTPLVSDAGQLGNSGPGTIITTASFANWPTSGWCRIGNLREIVYYDSRTATDLNVTGRGRLGTTASAGANTDVIQPVPGIAIAWDNNQPLLTIANENTAPAGITWNLGITEETGLSLDLLAAGQYIGFWMWRELPSGAVANPSVINDLQTSFYGW